MVLHCSDSGNVVVCLHLKLVRDRFVRSQRRDQSEFTPGSRSDCILRFPEFVESRPKLGQRMLALHADPKMIC